MKLRYALAASAAAFALGFGAPALAQDNNDNNDNNDVNVAANGSLNASQGGEADTVADESSNAASRGGEVDTTASHGSYAASRGGEIEVGNTEFDTEFDTQATNGSNAASRGGEVNVGNSTIVADQELKAIIINKYLDEVVDLDGEDETDTAVGYNSGQNQIRGNAFAAYAGILNQAWNTGINANTQAATNMAAQGTVNFGSNGDGDNGGGNGD